MDLQTSVHARGEWSRPLRTELDGPETLVLAFGASKLAGDPEPLRALHRAFPHSRILGCSTAGEIHQGEVRDDSLVVAVARFASTTLRMATAPIATGAASFRAGQALAAELDRPDLRCVLVLSDGLDVNGSALVRGLNEGLPSSVVISGGLAGDGERFASTWVFHEGEPRRGLVSAVGLYGSQILVGHGCKGGWDMFGPERRITRSRDNVLYELDGRPALDLYKEYLGERATGLPATALLFPLSIRRSSGDDRRLVRTVLAVDEEARSLTFAGDVPEGSLAQLMHANLDRLVQGAHDAASLATVGAEAALSIAVSCVGRRLVLGERADEEVEAILDALPAGVEQVGFYSYGEISPFASDGCDLHNQTMTLCVLAEG